MISEWCTGNPLWFRPTLSETFLYLKSLPILIYVKGFAYLGFILCINVFLKSRLFSKISCKTFEYPVLFNWFLPNIPIMEQKVDLNGTKNNTNEESFVNGAV